MKKNIINRLEDIVSEKFKFWEVIILMGLTAIVGVLFGTFLAKKNYGIIQSSTLNSSLQEFINNYNYISSNYYGDFNDKTMLNKALQAILEEIDDPYAAYLDESQSSNFNILLSGSYYGLGIEVGVLKATNELIITQVINDSPASKAGLQEGDIILKINDEELTELSSKDFSEKIKQINGVFDLTVRRDNQEKSFSITLDTIIIRSSESKMFENKIGYISISVFADNTYDQVNSELQQLKNEGMKSLIIDVRDNSGGYLTSAEKILGLFLDSHHVIYQMEDKNGVTKFYSKGNTDANYNIVILTNEMSASASEIMTAALKEELNAISIGKKTFGKGSAQKLHTLSDGSKYKFTTQKWLTPSGNSIDKIGIDVNYDVTMETKYFEYPTEKNDNQLQLAIQLLNGD